LDVWAFGFGLTKIHKRDMMGVLGLGRTLRVKLRFVVRYGGARISLVLCNEQRIEIFSPARVAQIFLKEASKGGSRW